jgi:hypothetical protein
LLRFGEPVQAGDPHGRAFAQSLSGLLFAVFVAMSARGVIFFFPRARSMGPRRLGMVSGLLMPARLMMSGRLAIVLGGLGMLLRRALVMLRCFFGHLAFSTVEVLSLRGAISVG